MLVAVAMYGADLSGEIYQGLEKGLVDRVDLAPLRA